MTSMLSSERAIMGATHCSSRRLKVTLARAAEKDSRRCSRSPKLPESMMLDSVLVTVPLWLKEPLFEDGGLGKRSMGSDLNAFNCNLASAEEKETLRESLSTAVLAGT